MNKQQTFSNSCGAASLLCAAAELGVKNISALGGSSVGQKLELNGNCEAALYELTSGVYTTGRVVPVDHSKLGYSMPHNVALAARELGLNVKIYMSGLIATALSTLYPDAEANCKRTGFPILREEAPALAADQRMLKILNTGLIGLHYVMKRPDGSYMDPGDGKDFSNFQAMGSMMKLYKYTGIALILQKPAGS